LPGGRRRDAGIAAACVAIGSSWMVDCMSRLLAVALIPLLLLSAAGVALAQSTPTAAAPTLFIRQDPTLGPYFTDPQGHTLYHFTQDQNGQSSCTGGCAKEWAPLAAPASLSLPDGVDGKLTTISRADGTTQVAYNGMALYHYDDDKQAGQLEGQGEHGVWFVVSPGEDFDSPPTHATTKAAAATPSADGNVAVTLKEFSVASSATSFKVGQPYTFTITNDGQYAHQIEIEPAGAIDQPLTANGQQAKIASIDPGKSQTLTWTFAKPGAYQIACHRMDHYAKGMVVTIHVAS
jgi:predicted lipoprotein with Yx(FWY)xxD motif/uncharacterized cupredoxin-like copper-binding protein